MNNNIFREWAKAGKAKKEEKQIDELSKDTLKSYQKKATSKALDGMMGASDKDVKNFDKRMKGISKATDRLNKEDKQIDELSKDTLKSYRKKADKSAVDSLTSNDPKQKLKYGKRLTGMGRATKRLNKEEKQIDELSKDTLGKYAVKATAAKAASKMQLDKKKKSSDLAHQGKRPTSVPGKKGVTIDKSLQYDRTIRRSAKTLAKREKGLQKAGERLLRKEAYKQDGEIAGIISELKARTIGSYIRKATDNLARQKSGYETTKKHNQRSQEMRGKVSKGMQSMQNVYKDKIKKREKGLDQADRALAKKEDTNLDELSSKTLNNYISKSFGDKKRKAGVDKAGDKYRKKQTDKHVSKMKKEGYEFSEEELAMLEAKLAQLEEALKGDQHKLDVDKDGDIEADDLKKLRSKKKKKDDEEEVVMNPKKGDESTNENVKSADRKPEKYKDEKGRERVRMVAVDRDMIKKESVDMSIRDKLMSVLEKKKHGDTEEKQAHDDNWSPSAKKMADDHKGETEDLADKASKSIEDANKKTAGSSQHNRPADNKQGDKSIVNQVADALKGLSKK